MGSRRLSPKDYIVADRIEYTTIREMLIASMKQYNDHILYRHKVNGSYVTYTYSDVFTRASAFGMVLQNKYAIRKGDRIALYSENRPEWCIAYIGLIIIGAVVVPIDAQALESDVLHILNHAEVSLICVSKKTSDNVINIIQHAKKCKNIVSFDEAVTTKKVVSFSESINTIRTTELKEITVQPHDSAEILYTSGTTGVSKAVILSQGNIIEDIKSICSMVRFTPDDVFLEILPIHHVFEGTCSFLLSIYRGSAVTIAESYNPKNIVANIKETKVSIILAVPLLFEKIYNNITRAVQSRGIIIKVFFNTIMLMTRFARIVLKMKIGRHTFNWLRKKAGLASIRFVVAGGGPLPLYVAQGFDDIGITILQGYGLTETSPVISVSTLEYNEYRSVGLPIPGVEVKIDRPNNESIGEICCRGPIVMQGYYKDIKATQQVIDNEGWFHTGDLGYIDDTGFVYITGRCKNLIVTHGGKNVYPEEIEMKLNKSPFILESMVYGQAESETIQGERVCTLIVPDYEAIETYSAEHMIHYETDEDIEMLIKSEIRKVSSQLPVYKRIVKFSLHAEPFRKTSTKKIKRYLYSSTLQKV